MNNSVGRIEVICGPMFSGKTEELIRRIRRAKVAGQYVEVFTPDTAVKAVAQIVSHAERKLDGVPVQSVKPDANILRLASLEMTKVLALDEAQFFDPSIVLLVRRIAELGVKVLVAGLDMDYRGEPFAIMGTLMSVADEVLKLSAVCVRCKRDANRTQRLIESTSRVLIGSVESYEARCSTCFQRPLPSV
jgi:thymidine kinase